MDRSSHHPQEEFDPNTPSCPKRLIETLSYHNSPQPKTFGHYQLLGKLGQGGMGVVFAAIDSRLNRRVAIKFMQEDLATHPDAKERFLREARNAAQIKDDHVVTIYETNEIEGIPYFAMEYLEGISLEEYLRRNATPTIPQILRIGLEIATGLAQAHRIGVIHRDIKPANLWLEAPHGRIKILDFGLAKLVDEETNLSQHGVLLGTPTYMSPEQASRQILDARSDLFSLGSVLYRLCVARPPFVGNSVAEVLHAIENDPVVPIRESNPEIPEALATLIGSLLEKDPKVRTQNAETVVSEINSISRQLGISTDVANTFIQFESLQPQTPIWQSHQETQGVPKNATMREDKPKRYVGSRWLLFGVFVLVGLLAFGLFLLNNDKEPLPPAKKEELPNPIPPEVEPKQKTENKEKPILPPTNPYHRAAEYLLTINNHTSIELNGRAVKLSHPIPEEPFTFKIINLGQNKKIRDTHFEAFVGCKRISVLQLSNTPISDEGLKFFDGIESVDDLNLRGTNTTAVGLSYFKKCVGLTALCLDTTKVSDQGFEIITTFNKLFSLNLDDTLISDASIPHLVTLKKMRGLTIRRTQITEQGLKTLQESLPYCNVAK